MIRRENTRIFKIKFLPKKILLAKPITIATKTKKETRLKILFSKEITSFFKPSNSFSLLYFITYLNSYPTNDA